MRAITAYLIAPIMAMSCFSFSKKFRHEITPFHAFVYAVCNTVLANTIAVALNPIGYDLKLKEQI